MILLLNPPATSKPGFSRKKAANLQLRCILFVIRSDGIGSTRIRRENPVFNYGFFRPNPLVFGSAPWENDEHAPELTRRSTTEQSKIARPARKSFAHAPGVTFSRCTTCAYFALQATADSILVIQRICGSDLRSMFKVVHLRLHIAVPGS